jgi:predicted DNA-binding transcriptional regulator AlpA
MSVGLKWVSQRQHVKRTGIFCQESNVPPQVKSALRNWRTLAEKERLLTAIDVARVTGFSTETLAQWRSQGRGIPYFKLSRNVIRYRQCDLDDWLAARLIQVTTVPPARGA